MPPDLATARALAESQRLGAPAEYQREILCVLLALLDALTTKPTEAPAEVAPVVAPPEVKRGRPR